MKIRNERGKKRTRTRERNGRAVGEGEAFER